MNASDAATQWKALAARERIYKTKPITSREIQDARALVVKWAYKVVDRYDMERWIVGFAFNFFDRFMGLYSDFADLECTQLLAMTCVYVAAKLHGNRRNPLSISRLVRMSKGYFEREQIIEMERRLISILAWYMNPPIPMLFLETVRHFLFKNKHLSSSKKDQIFDMSSYLIELSVCDHFFSTKRPSCIAVAALKVGLETAGCQLELQVPLPDTDEAKACLIRMRKLYRSASEDKEEESRCSDSSPTDVMVETTQSL
jgi:hypothetical protein